MKSYKLVNSREVQEKALKMGYEYFYKSSSKKEECLFMFLCYGGGICFKSTLKEYKDSSFREITQADFLALPEPFIVGDWVKFESNGRIVIFKIVVLNNENESFWLDPSIDGRYFNLDYCTKLTQGQIDILGLE